MDSQLGGWICPEHATRLLASARFSGVVAAGLIERAGKVPSALPAGEGDPCVHRAACYAFVAHGELKKLSAAIRFRKSPPGLLHEICRVVEPRICGRFLDLLLRDVACASAQSQRRSRKKKSSGDNVPVLKASCKVLRSARLASVCRQPAGSAVVINAPDVHGDTALHVAASELNVIAIARLLAAGAKPVGRCKAVKLDGPRQRRLTRGALPAALDGTTPLIALVQHAGAAIAEGQGTVRSLRRAIQLLRDSGDAWDSQDRRMGYTPLHWAAATLNRSVVQEVLRAMQSESGSTAHLALVARSRWGNTPLHVWCNATQEQASEEDLQPADDAAIVQLLLPGSCITNSAGHTAAQIAAVYGRQAALAVLGMPTTRSLGACCVAPPMFQLADDVSGGQELHSIAAFGPRVALQQLKRFRYIRAVEVPRPWGPVGLVRGSDAAKWLPRCCDHPKPGVFLLPGGPGARRRGFSAYNSSGRLKPGLVRQALCGDRVLVFECTAACGLGVSCNRVVGSGEQLSVSVSLRWREDIKGFGLFYSGTSPLQVGTYVGCYSGQLVLDPAGSCDYTQALPVLKHPEWRGKSFIDAVGDELDPLDGDAMLLDGRVAGNATRFVNNSHVRPNLCLVTVFSGHVVDAPRWWEDSRPVQVPLRAFFTAKRILPGEEMLWDYMWTPGTSAEADPISCGCGCGGLLR
mmetsp:Transcript_41514/g.90416  ORF Transcript_41514/g.90416 Transcript_41514/m.90416 type:complete len:690 (-) Transcript_41514:339-2408(-)